MIKVIIKIVSYKILCAIKDTSYAKGKKQQNLQLLDILLHNSVNIPSFQTQTKSFLNNGL